MTRVNPLDPHHDGSSHYVRRVGAAGHGPTGGHLELGDRLELRVRVPHAPNAGVGTPGAEKIVLRAVRDGEPVLIPAVQKSTDEAGAWWTVEVELVNRRTSYRFAIVGGDPDYRWLNATGVYARDVTDAGDFKISTEHRAPDWVTDQIGYQVFPDRFARTETGAEIPAWAQPAQWDDPVLHKGPDVVYQWYGGTLDGIAAHLDHIAGLGASMLYLTPIFEARSNHRYDAISFDRVDSLLGGDAALDRLIAATKDAGLRLMGDLTTNHTGDAHDWFLVAQDDPDSAEREFYRFGADNSYVAWLDVPSLPKLDHTSTELARRLYAGPDSVAANWLRHGLDGWRIDVANMTGRLGADDLAHRVAADLRQTMSESSPTGSNDTWLLAEHGHDAAGDLQGPGWHGTMDYAGFTRPVWCWLNGGAPDGPGLAHGLDYLGIPIDVPVLSAEAVVATMRDVHGGAPWTSWASSTLHLDSHDTPRFRTVAGGGVDGRVDGAGHGRERHLVGLGLQMTLPGVPVVFMGDELGLTGVDGEHSRTPYPWELRETWDKQTLQAYRWWMALRRDHVALRRGGLHWLYADGDAMVYLREHRDETMLIYATRAPGVAVELPATCLGPTPQLDALIGEPAELDSVLTLTASSIGVAVHTVTAPRWPGPG